MKLVGFNNLQFPKVSVFSKPIQLILQYTGEYKYFPVDFFCITFQVWEDTNMVFLLPISSPKQSSVESLISDDCILISYVCILLTN